MVKAVFLKPLDGLPEGTEREFEKDDFERLRALGAVREAGAKAEKAAPPVENKMAPEVQNKADQDADNRAVVTAGRHRRRG